MPSRSTGTDGNAPQTFFPNPPVTEKFQRTSPLGAPLVTSALDLGPVKMVPSPPSPGERVFGLAPDVLTMRCSHRWRRAWWPLFASPQRDCQMSCAGEPSRLRFLWLVQLITTKYGNCCRRCQCFSLSAAIEPLALAFRVLKKLYNIAIHTQWSNLCCLLSVPLSWIGTFAKGPGLVERQRSTQ